MEEISIYQWGLFADRKSNQICCTLANGLWSLISGQRAGQWVQVVEALRGKRVCQVAAGFYHTLCLVGPMLPTAPRRHFRSTLPIDLRKLINNPTRSDVTFIVEGGLAESLGLPPSPYIWRLGPVTRL